MVCLFSQHIYLAPETIKKIICNRDKAVKELKLEGRVIKGKIEGF